MGKKLVEIFTILEKVFGYAVNLITFFLMFILNPGHTFKEIQDKRMHNGANTDQSNEVSDGVDADFFLEITREHLNSEINRGTVVDEKNKVLLTVAALLMAADAAVLLAINHKWIALLPMLPTTAAIFLILIHFGVRVVPVPNYREIFNDINTKNAKINLGKEYLNCESKFSQSNNYFVGVYRASCRATILGVFLLIPAFICVGNNSENELIKTIKNNTELIKLLRGPQGPHGIPGPMGPPGPKGEIRLTGPQGPPGKVILESSKKTEPEKDNTKKLPVEQRH